MRYDISKPSAPKMPKLGKGTECIKMLLSQASKDMRKPLVPMFFPTFVIYLVLRKNSTFNSFGRCFEAKWLTSLQKVGVNKGQLSLLVEAICRDFMKHNKEELAKLVDW